MINGKRVAVVMPAYNAEHTLEATVREIPDLVDIRILVDDYSKDKTVEVARRLGLNVFVHKRNLGYGGNQQTCYREALAAGADVVVMVHPDYQYTPLLITPIASMVAYDIYDVVLGSRIIGGQAMSGGMPLYKYISNRFLRPSRTCFWGPSSPSTTPATARLAARYWRPCRCWRIRRTSSSTIRCSPSACTSAFASARCPAPRSISKRHPPSTSGAA